MDDRSMREIEVTWQLGVVVVGLFALPIALAPVFTAVLLHEAVSASAMHISEGIAIGLAVAILIAVLARVYDAGSEFLPDGHSKRPLVVRQIVIGLSLIVLGAGIMAILGWLGLLRKLAVCAGLVSAGPGVLLVARAMVPAPSPD